MAKRQDVRVTVFSKSICGSLTKENKYGDDKLLQVRDWIDSLLNKIPEEHRDRAFIDVESIGGYEGEHHPEVEVYYIRPETEAELAVRVEGERTATADKEAQERRMLSSLKAKYDRTVETQTKK